MQVVKTSQEWFKIRQKLTQSTIGYVPTTGALHQGHECLLTRSRQENAISVLSIFINPTQFTEEEYLNYPRPLDEDMAIATQLGVDYLFMPEFSDLYPENVYFVGEKILSHKMEGAREPGVFQRTLTNMLKFLMLIRPTNAYFGEKDYQQFQLIHGLAKAFFLDINIVPCAIIRNQHGLPLSSRNERLSEKEKLLANRFSEIFQQTQLSTDEIVKQLTAAGIKTEYMIDEQSRRFCAVRIGETRIIDNRKLINIENPKDTKGFSLK